MPMPTSSSPSPHPQPESFDRLVRGKASPEEAREIVRHMLAGCAGCAVAAEAARTRLAPRGETEYGAAFQRVGEKLAGCLETHIAGQVTGLKLAS
jgi:hypothetical protein